MTTVDEFRREPPASARERLAGRAEELGRRWREAAALRLRARSGWASVGTAEMARLLELLRWVAGAPSGETELPHRLVAVLGEVVLQRRGHGRLLEEVLIELCILQEVLLDAEAEDAPASRDPALAGDIGRRMAAIITLVAGMYNDEVEQERREERRKLDSFTRMVSHEMRTPIGAAFTAGRMLEDLWDELPPEERASMLEVVGRGLSRAAHLIESVTSLALVRDADRAVDRRGLRSVIESVLGELEAQARQAGVRIEVPDALPAALVDARRTAVVLANLLSNAVDYADPAKDDRWVQVRVRRDTDRYGWRIRVEDNGVGIDPADQVHVFRRFYRAHAGLASGTGLGLAVAREAAEGLGGEIALESTPGVGSTFAFTVPDEQPTESAGTGGEPTVPGGA